MIFLTFFAWQFPASLFVVSEFFLFHLVVAFCQKFAEITSLDCNLGFALCVFLQPL